MSASCTVRPPPGIQASSITIYLPSFPSPTSPAPSLGHHPTAVCVWAFVCCSSLSTRCFQFYVPHRSEITWFPTFSSDLFRVAWYSPGPSTFHKWLYFICSQGQVVIHCTDAPWNECLPSAVLCWRTFCLFPRRGHREWCLSEHRGAYVFANQYFPIFRQVLRRGAPGSYVVYSGYRRMAYWRYWPRSMQIERSWIEIQC